MKKELLAAVCVCLLLLMTFDSYGQEPRITQYRVRVWLSRGYTTVTVGTLNVYIGGLQYTIPAGVNSNNYMYYDNKSNSGALPALHLITVVGNYSCWSQSTGTRNFTVNATIPNTAGCGGQYSHSNTSGQSGVTFHVFFEPIQIPTPTFNNTPGCLDDDIIWPIVNHHNNQGAGNTSQGSSSYALQIGIYNGGADPTNIRNIVYNTVGWQQPPMNRDVSFNLQTVLGANASQYIGQQVVFRSYREGTSTPCSDYFDKIYSQWTAPYIIYPPGPKLSSAITSTVPHCSNKPNTATLTVPPINGVATRYDYSVTKLVPVVTGNECASYLQITHNGNKYCPGTSTINRTASGAGSEIFANLSAGVYQVTIENKDIQNPCPRWSTHQINDAAPFTATASPNIPNANGVHIACNGGNSGQILYSVSGGLAPMKYYVNNVERSLSSMSPPTVSGLTAGLYTVKLIDANGCDTDAPISNVTLIETSAANAFKVSYNDIERPTCYGSENGYVSLLLENGTGPYTYSLNNIPVDAAGTAQSPRLTSLKAGVGYTIIVTDGNNCKATPSESITLSQPDPLNYDGVTPVHLKCNGVPTGELTLINPSGGTLPYQYAIIDSLENQSGFQAASQFNNLLSNKYKIRITDSKSCTKVSTVTHVTQPKRITFGAITHNTQSCSEKTDGEIYLAPGTGGTGARMFSIDSGPFTGETSAMIFTELTSKNYIISARDENQCVVTTNYFVPSNAIITGDIEVEHPISCYGDNDGALKLTAGGGLGPYTYEWTSAKWTSSRATQNISGLDSAQYTVIIVDNNQCKKDFSYTLSHPEKLSLQVAVRDYNGSGVSCLGSSDGAIDLTVRGGISPFYYSWSNGENIQDIAALPKGIYSITVRDDHACISSMQNIEITEPSQVLATIQRTKDISCHGFKDGEIEARGSGGAGEYEYSLNAISWQNDFLFTGLTPANYVVYTRDGNRCQAQTANTILIEPPALTLTSLAQENTTCGESNGMAEVQVGGGVGNYRYEWYDEFHTLFSSQPLVNDLNSGFYEAYAFDGNTCEIKIDITIDDSDGPKITLQELTGLTCHDSDDGIIRITIDEGIAPYTINWSTGDSSTELLNLANGPYSADVRDANGCRTLRVFNVPAPLPITLQSIITQPLCAGNSNGQVEIMVNGGNAGGYDYTWGHGAVGTVLSGLQAGVYKILIEDSRQCKLEKEISVVDPPVFTVNAGGDRTICVGQNLSVRADEDNAQYAWTSDKNYESIEREVILTEPARYTLRVVNKNGCEAEDSFYLQTSNDLLKADFLMVSETYVGDTVVMVDISWPVPERTSWTIPQGAIVTLQDQVYAQVVFKEEGTYTIILHTNLGECIASLAKSIFVLGERPVEGGRQSSSLVTRFEVYPNPSDGNFSVYVDFEEPQNAQLKMVNQSGNQYFINTKIKGQVEYTYEAQLTHLTSGLYFLILEVGNKKIIKRVIIR